MNSIRLFRRLALAAVGLPSLVLGWGLSAHGQSLSEALDHPAAVWTTSATDWVGNPTPGGEWAGQAGVTHDGADAARSGPLPFGHLSRLSTTSFAGPGTVTFWRRHGLGGGQNSFTLLANGGWIGLYLAGNTWQPVALDLPPGPASIECIWSNNDVNATEADNFAYLDEVAFHAPGGAPSFLADPLAVTMGEGYSIQPSIAVLGEKPMDLELMIPSLPKQGQSIAPRAVGGPAVVSGWVGAYDATPAVAGLWTITASNTLGVVTRAFSVTVTSTPPHSIYLTGPTAAWAGANVTLQAEARGTAPFSYQWRKAGQDLPGKTGPTLTLAGFSSADEGDYTVVASNALGHRESDALSLSLGSDPPAIRYQPATQDMPVYGYLSLDAGFSGTPPFGVAWWRNGAIVQQEAESAWGNYGLTIPGDPETDPGVYWLMVATGLGRAQTTNFVVQVGDGAAIADAVNNRSVGWRTAYLGGWSVTSLPASSHDGVAAASVAGNSAPLKTSVEGPSAANFWWRVEDGELALSVDATMVETLSNLVGDSGWQQVNVAVGPGWHELTWALSSAAGLGAAYLDEVTVLAGGGGPLITTQPESADLSAGGMTTFTVAVTGTGPFTYTLHRDQNNVVATHVDSPDPRVSFELGPVTTADAGAYHIEVTDSAGRRAASDDAVVSVDGDYGSLQNLAAALGQPSLSWSYSDYSVRENQPLTMRPWYRTRQDGVPNGSDGSARTPPLAQHEMAAVATDLTGPVRVRFSIKLPVNTAWADVLGFSLDGRLENLTERGVELGASGESWTILEALVPDRGGPSVAQWEVVANSDGLVVHLGHIEITPATRPAIVTQPADLIRPAGEPGALTVTVTSPVPVTYQWFKVGAGAVGGQTGNTLAFPSLAAADAGQYYAEAANDFGTTQSASVLVTVTGPRPRIDAPLQPQWLRPGDGLRLPVVATSFNLPLSYRWFRNGVLRPETGAVVDVPAVTTADAGAYRVEISDGYYVAVSEAMVAVAPVLYQVTWLPSPDPGGYAQPTAINNAGVVAGYAGSLQTVATIWQNGAPVRLTGAGASFSQGFGINDQGQVVGLVVPVGGSSTRTLAQWVPPYTPDVFTDLGTPPGHPFLDTLWINNQGQTVGTDNGSGLFGQPRFAFRHTLGGQWQSLGPLVGAAPLSGLDQGWATALGQNNAGVIVGLTYFQEPAVANATGWIYDPTVSPPQRTAMDTLSPELAITPTQPWGWADAVNDLGDIVARRYGAGSPTRLFLIRPGGQVHRLFEVPALAIAPDSESFNVDALNNRREMVGVLRDSAGQLRAALVRDRTTPRGGTPTTFTSFALYDLNDLVVGGTGDFILGGATGLNDAGQIVGWAKRADGGVGERPGFLLTPVTAYPGLRANAVDDLIVRSAGQGVRFDGASLVGNDLGIGPLTLTGIDNTSASGGTIAAVGGGAYEFTPPVGPDAPDSFGYRLQAADGSTATGMVRVQIAPGPRPPSNGAPVQVLPGGELRVRFAGVPGRTYRIEISASLTGPWFTLATIVVGPDGAVEYIDAPPPGLVARFYRTVEL